MSENSGQFGANDFSAKIKYLCKKFPKREAGSDSERAASDLIAEKLSSCAEVTKEDFAVFPSAHMSWTIISTTAIILAYAAYFFSTLVAATLLVVACAVYVGEYMLCKRLLDPLFVKATSQNVTAVRRSSEEAKRRLYFVAHVDATREWRVKRRFGGVMFIIQRVSNVVGVVYLTAITVARWALVGGVGAGIAEGVMLWMGVAGSIFLFTFFATYFFIDPKNVVDGANDGLSGVAVATTVLRAMEEKGIRLKDTDVGVILTGGSSCGLRGAKAWCDAHARETDGDNTMFVALNCLREANAINIDTVEMNWIVKNDKDAIDSARKAAEAAGVKCSAKRIPFGSTTDGAAFTQAGLKSVSITAMDRNLPDYYRTRYDSYDNLSEECMENCFRLLLGMVEQYSGEEVLSRFDFAEAEPLDPEIPATRKDEQPSEEQA